MKPGDVKRRLKRRFKRLQLTYNNARASFEADAIHEFRLQVKKLNAFLWLLNGGAPKGKLKIEKPLHHFYQTVGTIRNVQLHQKKIEDLCRQQKLPLPLYYFRSLQNGETDAINVAREAALPVDHKKHFNCKKYLHKIRAAAPRYLKAAALKSFININHALLVRLLTKPVLREEDLHEVRKISKRFLYVWPWIKKALHKGLPSFNLSKEGCSTLAAKLGDFVDSCVALRFFEGPYGIVNVNAEEITILQSLQSHFAADRQRRYIDVVAMLKNLVPENKKDMVLLSSSTATVLI